MKGQGAIIGVGSMEYPPEFQGASEETLTRNAISKIMTLTSTYDHRVIQGAQSGEFLKRMHGLLLGEDHFYDEIFRALRIPYEPIRWSSDISTSHDDEISKQARILELIHAYRVRGHMMADTDPLEYRQRSHPDLEVESHGLTLWDLDREFATGSFGGERRFMKMRSILGILRDSYCRTVGIEYMHIQDPEQRRWIQERVEQPHQKPPREEQLRILLKLNQAEAFETFLQTKFVGQKRFSLEGGETTVPLIDEICEAAAEGGLDEVTIGMAHRGRLNVLANIVGKSYSQIFREFEGNIDPRTVQGSGDVKYHLGAEGEFLADSGDKIKVSVAANPSHLEAVDPVLEGIARAKQDVLNQGEAFPVLPLLVHGDAAFAGQGVVAETLNLSQLRGYRTGGTDPRGRQQPGRLHHLAGRVALLALLHRRRPDGAGADLPRERRRPRGLHPGRAAGLRVPPGVQQGRRHRPGLLPASRPQRGRRPVVHPAADVRPDRAEALGAQALHRVADRPRRHHHGRGRAGPQGLPAAARAGLHRGARGDQRPRVLDDGAGLPGEEPRGLHHRHPEGDAEADRRRLRQRAGRLHGAPEGAAAAAAARGGDDRGPDRLGRRRDPRARLAADGRPAGAARRPGLAPRHVREPVRHDHRPHATPTSGRRWPTSPRTRPASTSTTRCSRSTPPSGSSTATRWRGPTRWSPGRRSSATSSTAPRP